MHIPQSHALFKLGPLKIELNVETLTFKQKNE